MRNYKKNGVLVVSFIIIFILTLVFFYLLNKIKLWTFNSYNILKAQDDMISILILEDDLLLFRENSFFYYDTKKYYYEIEQYDEYEKGIILILNIEDDISLLSDRTLLLPNIKKNVLSLIIDSWRSK